MVANEPQQSLSEAQAIAASVSAARSKVYIAIAAKVSRVMQDLHKPSRRRTSRRTLCHGWKPQSLRSGMDVEGTKDWKMCSTFSRGEEVRDFLPFPLSPEPTKTELKLSMTCAWNLAISAACSCSLDAPSADRVRGLLYDSEVCIRNVPALCFEVTGDGMVEVGRRSRYQCHAKCLNLA